MDDMAPQWRKSTRSTAQGSCVELGNGTGGVLVRDTTEEHKRDRTTLSVPAGAWQTFADSLK